MSSADAGEQQVWVSREFVRVIFVISQLKLHILIHTWGQLYTFVYKVMSGCFHAVVAQECALKFTFLNKIILKYCSKWIVYQ